MEHLYAQAFMNVMVRPLDGRDIDNLRQWRNDGSNTKYLSKIGQITAAQQEQWYRNYLKNENEICFAIDETATLQRIVGSASLYNFDGNQGEFGKILIGEKEAHGKKVGYNAIIAILKIAFYELGLDKVILHCFKENEGAIHVYEQVGFKLVDEHENPGGLEYLMEVVKEDYMERYGAV